METTRKVEPQESQGRGAPGKVEFRENDDAPRVVVSLEDGFPEGYDPSEHKKLKKYDFKEVWMFESYRAAYCRYQIQELSDREEQHRRNAEQIKKFGDPKILKKAQKLRRMREQMAALEEEIAASIDDEDDDS